MKKKYLAWFFFSETINEPLSTHSFLINKLSENFEKIFLINLKYLDLELNKKLNYPYKFENQANDKFHLNNNIEIINLKSSEDFINFIADKKLNAIIINNFGTNPPSLKLLRYLKKFEITLFEINDISNIDIKQKIEFKYFLKGFYFKLNKFFYNFFLIFFQNLRLIKKNEIKFCSNLKKIESFRNKNFFNFLVNYKDIIKINSRAFDMLNSEKPNIKYDKIVLLDDHFGHPSSLAMRGKLSKEDIDAHYKYLNNLLNIIGKQFNKKIVICIHPKDDLELKKKIFSKYEVLKFQTREKIIESFLVLFFESTAIIDAILLNKNIITIYSEFMDNSVKYASDYYKNNIGIIQIKLESEMSINKTELEKKLTSSKVTFNRFISRYVAIDEKNLGYQKITKYLLKYF
tara:strand:- start:6084 stop:7292 length:1209 start_codon:yes stop_codon:yes gene_type:complete